MSNQTFVFGHKNPDTDSITSSIVMANLETKLGNPAKAVRTGNVNKETEYVLQYLGMEAPDFVEDVENGQEVILVDHNEATQCVANIANAHIQKVVDHHTMNFIAPYQLYYRAEPVGCTATVLYKMYQENGVEIDSKIATLMLSAIVSDTLLFKSPTCTPEDKQIAQKLADIAGVNIQEYGKNLLKAGTDISEFSPSQVINIDSKLFEKDGKKYLFLTELKSTFDSSDIFHASTQLVSSYLKINMILHLLPCYRCEDFIVKGFIVSHEPNPSYIRDLQKAMFLPKRSKYKTDAEFVTDLLIRGRKFSTTVQPTDYHELKGLPLGERGIFSSMEIHYIPISDKQPSISIDALEYI